MSNVVLDYAVAFNQVTALSAPSYGFLRSVGVAVPVEGTGTAGDITEVTTQDELDAISPTYGAEIGALFDGGLNRITLLVVADITGLTALIDGLEADFYTLANSSAFVNSEFLTASANWGAVRCFSDVDKQTCVDNAKTANVCAFFENGTTKNAYKMFFAFGTFLAATLWRNQQYIPSTSESGAVKTVGDAETLYNDRVSFFLTGDSSGTRLGFFCVGGLSITTPYVSKELELSMQFQMTNYLTVNQPFNVELSRASLARIGNKQVKVYLDAGLLDPDETNTISITKSVEVFEVNGALTTAPAIALWRVKISAYQTQG